MIRPLNAPTMATPPADGEAALMNKAKDLETAFLSEMLGFSGLGQTEGSFTGGAGEDQFASFLREEQARLMVERGGIGLAQIIFESLKSAEGSPDDTP